MESVELVIGIHSIVEALKNEKRVHSKLVGTEESVKEVKGRVPKDIFKELTIEIKGPHHVQEFGKRHYSKLGFTYQRIPSNIFLLTSRTKVYRRDILEQRIIEGNIVRMLALDKVTDVNNVGAIIRSAAFYGVNAVIFARKGEFSLNPSIIRIASGGVDHLTIVQTSNLSKLISKLQDIGVNCIGLSEHASEDDQKIDLGKKQNNPMCIVMGAEDTGISNAVSRKLEHHLSIKGDGPISTLNVSVATAVVMEKFWGEQ